MDSPKSKYLTVQMKCTQSNDNFNVCGTFEISQPSTAPLPVFGTQYQRMKKNYYKTVLTLENSSLSAQNSYISGLQQRNLIRSKIFVQQYHTIAVPDFVRSSDNSKITNKTAPELRCKLLQVSSSTESPCGLPSLQCSEAANKRFDELVLTLSTQPPSNRMSDLLTKAQNVLFRSRLRKKF